MRKPAAYAPLERTMRIRFGRSRHTAQFASPVARSKTKSGATRWLVSAGLLLAGCMAFQDVELSTERVGVAGAMACEPGEKSYCNDTTKVHNVCVDGFWQTGPKCPLECHDERGCVDCKPKTDHRCVGSVLEVCDEQGKFARLKDCLVDEPATPLCDTEQPRCVECTSTETQCSADGETLSGCSQQGKFVTRETCSYAATRKCIAVQGIPTERADYCAQCDPDVIRCFPNTDVINVCGEDYRYPVVPTQQCGVNSCNVTTLMCNPD